MTGREVVSWLLLVVVNLLLLVALIWSTLQLHFYKAYFRRKQRNAGNNPDQILRSEFGRFWHLFQ